MTNQDSTILLYVFNNQIEAVMAQQKLESYNIYSFIENENTAGLTPLGGNTLMVFLKDKEKALEILSKDTIK